MGYSRQAVLSFEQIHMKNIAIIPARYGSKRIPQKNLKLLGGKPLLLYTVEQALKSQYIQQIVISTDIPGINELLKVLDQNRIRVHQRPASLAGDLTSTEEVLLGVLDQDWAKGTDYVVTLLPTSPFRSAGTIDRCIEFFLKKQADSVLTISRSKLKIGVFDPETKAFSLLIKNPPARMSEWPLTSWDNPAVYVTRVDVLREKKFILGKNTFALEIDKVEGYDINDLIDWAFAESLIEKGFVK